MAAPCHPCWPSPAHVALRPSLPGWSMNPDPDPGRHADPGPGRNPPLPVRGEAGPAGPHVKFYGRLGWRLDVTPPGVVQFTPHGSGCSVQFGWTAYAASVSPGGSKWRTGAQGRRSARAAASRPNAFAAAPSVPVSDTSADLEGRPDAHARDPLGNRLVAGPHERL